MDYTKIKSHLAEVSGSSGDSGLRDYMVSVYKDMSVALVVTAIVAFFVSSSDAIMSAIFGTGLSWLVVFAPLGVVIYMSAKVASITHSTARLCLFAYAALVGVSLSVIFVAYTDESVARIFLISAVVFGSMSLYGSVTNRDLSSISSFFYMGLFGVVLASFVNLFLQSSALYFITSVLCVLIFTFLTAYDTQRLKSLYYNLNGSQEDAKKVGVYGALSLYMNFINIFINLLRLFGERR